MLRVLYLAALVWALARGPRRRYPWFIRYTAAVLIVQTSRLLPNTVWYTRHVWAPLQVAATVLLLGAAWEAFYPRRDWPFLRTALLLGIMCTGAIPWYFTRDPRWPTAFIQIRDYLQIKVAATLTADLFVLLWWSFPAASPQLRHLGFACWITGWMALADLVYLVGGKWDSPLVGAAWWGIEGVPVLMAALGYLLWPLSGRRLQQSLQSPQVPAELR